MPLDHERRLEEISTKLVRAEEQLHDLKSMIETWREKRTYRLDKRVDAEGVGRYLWTYLVEPQEPVPMEWSLRIGEFLYTLHSSLDHLAWLLAAQKSFPADPGRVTFPIYASRS